MIETERLILRPLSPQDEEAFIRGIADDELRRMRNIPEFPAKTLSMVVGESSFAKATEDKRGMG